VPSTRFVDLQEGGGFGRFLGGACVAIAQGDRERAEAHGHACGRLDVGGAARDLVESAQHGEPFHPMRIRHRILERELAQGRWLRGLRVCGEDEACSQQGRNERAQFHYGWLCAGG
jgi:hypothetical protein